MLLNYHELTMDEAKDSPQKKLQFRVICMVMATSIVYSLISSGALRPVECTLGEFPGGEFIYKTTGRDYAASMSLLESIAKEVGIPSSKHGSIMYNLYLDDPLAVNGRKQRFATGILLNDETVAKGHPREETSHKLLQEINPTVQKPTEKEISDLAAVELWPKLRYHAVTLPPTKAVVVEYMFSNGFVSALLHSYKVFPTIRRYAKEQHGVTQSVPVVLTTCHISENKCFHYVPLSDSENVFRLGNHQWDPKKDGGGHVDWKGVRKMILKIVTLGQLGEDQDDYKVKEEKQATTTTTIHKGDEKEAYKEEPPVVVEETTSSEHTEEQDQQQEAEDTSSDEATATDQEREEIQAAEPTTESATEVIEDEPPQEEQQEQQDEATTTPEPPVEEETEQQVREQEQVQEATHEEEMPTEEESAATPNDQEASTEHETSPEEPVENYDAQQQHATADEVHDESPPVQDDESQPQRDEL